MISTTGIGMNTGGSARPEKRPRPEGFSPVNILAGGVHGILAPPQLSPGPPGARGRGLGRIEDKRDTRKGRVYVTFGGVDSLAVLWISVPFAAVFVLGCLTLA